MADPRYDVAISFLSADETTAASVYNYLREGLEVFFYPRQQETLAGTDGLETMRWPFLNENSRLVVVLYRELWGQTPWTGVEETAIRDRCLKDKFQSLFFMMLEDMSTVPLWLPATHVRFNYSQFGLAQAIGAIKARVQERGGTITPLTPLRRVELYKQEQEYLQAKQSLRSCNAREIVEREATKLLSQIKALCAQVTAEGTITIEFYSEGASCHIRTARVSLTVNLQWANFDSELVVREFDRKLAVPARGEQLIYVSGQPREIRATRFLPDLDRARNLGWIEQGQSSTFITSDALANHVVIQLIDLSERADRGEFRSSMPQSLARRRR
jgi:hypothetical protein